MDLVRMSERDLRRIEILSEVLAGRRTVVKAADALGITERHAYRLISKYQEEGGIGLAHKARGRESNRSINPGIRKCAVELVRTKYADFGPTLGVEVLADKHGICVGRETLRRWMMAEGLWLSRKQRKRFHQPRLRRENYGELVQIDGSEHRWFEDRGEPCTLLVFIDDATSKLMQLRFVVSETTESYFEALRGYLQAHGRPIAFYSDKHTVFRVNRDAKGGPGVTQFGRALAELNIDIMCANSSQAKGRVERANRTLQDRLVKELRLAGISAIEAGNAFLPSFLERFNERFAVPPAKPHDLHRPLQSTVSGLNDILCHRERRYVGEQLTFHYERELIILEKTEVSIGLAGRYVDVYDFAHKPMEVRWQGHVLPYRVFDKDQRVKPTAIVENKRLRHALSIIKAQQDLKQAARVLTNSEKIGYVKQPRRTYGPDFEMNQTVEVMVRPRLPKGPPDIYLSRTRLIVSKSERAKKHTVKT
jgi:transposase